jgi:hypothetical protein
LVPGTGGRQYIFTNISRLLDCGAMVQEDYISVLRTKKYYLNGFKIIIHMTEFYIGHLREIVSSYTAKKVFSQL